MLENNKNRLQQKNLPRQGGESTVQPLFINPFTDFAFKRIFGVVHNKDLTIDFLNALLKEYIFIKDIVFISTERSGRTRDIRKIVFDIAVETTDGQYIITIEMQYARQNFIKKRDLYYAASTIHEQLAPGSKEFNIKKTITVCITNFCFDEDNPDDPLHEVFRIDSRTGKEFDDLLRSFYIELPKFNKTENQLTNRLDQWIFALKNMHRLQEIPITLSSDPIFKKLFDVARLSNLTKEEMRTFLSIEKYRKDYDYGLHVAKQEGEQIGEQRGELNGIKKANLSKDTTFVTSLLQETDFSVEKIANLAGVSVDFVLKLKEKL